MRRDMLRAAVEIVGSHQAKPGRLWMAYQYVVFPFKDHPFRDRTGDPAGGGRRIHCKPQ
jgi:hypothetical protein